MAAKASLLAALMAAFILTATATYFGSKGEAPPSSASIFAAPPALAQASELALSASTPAPSVVCDPPAPAHPEPPVLSLRWQAVVSHGSLNATDPVVSADAVLFAGYHELTCVDRASGATRWRREGVCGRSRPALYGNSVLVLGGGMVSALSMANGASLWSMAVDGDGNPENDADVCVDGHRAYIATRAGSLYALDLDAKGRVMWKSANQGEMAWAPGLCAGGRLLLPLLNKRLRCLDMDTGEERWHAELPGLGPGQPLCLDGLALVATDLDRSSKISAFDAATGAWRWSEGDRADQRGYGGATVAGHLVVAGDARELAAFSPTGEARWRAPIKAFGSCRYAVDAHGRIWAGGDRGELLAFAAADGHELLRTSLDQDARIKGRPVHYFDAGVEQAASVGRLSAPIIRDDEVFVLTTGGIGLSWTLAHRP